MKKTVEVRFPDEVFTYSNTAHMTARQIVEEAGRRGLHISSAYDRRTKEEVYYITGETSDVMRMMEATEPKQLESSKGAHNAK